MRNRLFIGIVVALAAAGLWFALTTTSPTAKRTAESASPVAFTLADTEGKSLTAGRPGELTIVNFWATWCPPCRSEMPELDRFAKQHKEVTFYAVNIQEPSEKIKEFMQKNNYSLHVLLDKDGTIAKKFQITAIPTTIVIDKNGNIKYRKSGGVTQAELEKIIKNL